MTAQDALRRKNDLATIADLRARLAAVRNLYVEWTGSTNPILLSAAGLLRQAGGFALTEQEREQIRRREAER